MQLSFNRQNWNFWDKKGLIIWGQNLETSAIVYYLREIDDDKPIFNYGAVLTAIKIAYILPTKVYHDVYYFQVGTFMWFKIYKGPSISLLIFKNYISR